MSTTKSHSRKGQATRAVAPAATALVLAAHGERNVSDPNRSLIEHARAVAGRLNLDSVACGVLNGEPLLDTVLEKVAGSGAKALLIYPFFMSEGYFVETVLPERLSASASGLAATILPPLGHDPGLAKVMMAEALAAAKGAGHAPGETRLLIVGHGSKGGRASAEATMRISRKLESLDGFASVATAFLEEPPFIVNQLASEKGPVVVSGFFAGNGMHSTHDVPAAIEETGARAIYAGPVGASPAVRTLIAEAVEKWTGVSGA